MMPSLDHCVSNPSEMTTLTKTLEVFDTYKQRDDKDSDEESFHLPLDDDEIDPAKELELEEPIRNGVGSETEEEILNKFDNAVTVDQVDPHLEETLLNEDSEEKKDAIKENSIVSDAEQTLPEELEGSDCLNKLQESTSIDTADEPSERVNGIVVEDEKDDALENLKEENVVLGEEQVNSEIKEKNIEDVQVQNKEITDENTDKSESSGEVIDESNEEKVQAINQVVKEDSNDNKNVPGIDEDENISNSSKEADATVTSCDKPDTHQELNTENLPADDNATMGDSRLNETNEDQIKITDSSSDNSSQKNEEDKLLEKCENSNDSTKQQNEDSEDLFDISVIRDAEEDNAENAYNEAHPEENNVEENEEDDDERGEEKMDEDSGNEKINNLEEEEEEMDIDKHEDQLKHDDVEIEEENLKLDGDSDEVKDTICDSGDSETINKTDLVKINDKQTVDESVPSVEKECVLDEVTGTLVDADGMEISPEDKTFEKTSSSTDESNKENGDLEARKSLKRTLTDEEDLGTAKKSRTEDGAVEIKDSEKPKEKLPLKTLVSLSDFMRTKKNNKRLSMHDLEEFCVQKICEAIVHKSELGDVHHQLKLQEQLIETMRKEIQQLTKQARDLEIVNKKLMSDLKQQTATQKPLNPLKITRSVGLQVKFTPAFDASMKRRQPNTPVVPGTTTVNQKVQTPTTPNRNCRVIPNTTTTPINRQVSSPQKQQQQIPKPNTPLLSQALQSRRSVNDSANKVTNQAIRPKPADPKTGTPSSSVIDLTDEDDKKDKNKNSPSKLVTSKNIATVPLRTTPVRVSATTQGIRLTTSQGKVSPITSVVTSSAPQVMYVVQSSPQNVLTSALGPKAVVVNFQSANGVLTSALNGSAVSVIPKQGNTIQLKTVAPPSKPLPNNKVVKMPNKHPAPLPIPPVVRINSEKPLKPIPPKPHLTIRKTDTGIILQWKMPYELDNYEVIASYQLYAYQETSAMPSTDMWRKVGDVKALALPMACTLTQFADKNKYYFAVRPVDIHKRIGMFSDPEEISL